MSFNSTFTERSSSFRGYNWQCQQWSTFWAYCFRVFVTSSRAGDTRLHKHGPSIRFISGEFVLGLCLGSRHCDRFGKGRPHAVCVCVCVCVCEGYWRFSRLVAGCQRIWHDSYTSLSAAAVKCIWKPTWRITELHRTPDGLDLVRLGYDAV